MFLSECCGRGEIEAGMVFENLFCRVLRPDKVAAVRVVDCFVLEFVCGPVCLEDAYIV